MNVNQVLLVLPYVSTWAFTLVLYNNHDSLVDAAFYSRIGLLCLSWVTTEIKETPAIIPFGHTGSQWIVRITRFGPWGRRLHLAVFNLYSPTLLKLTWVKIGIKRLRVKKLHAAMLASGLERSGQRNAGDPTFGPHPPLTNPPTAGGAGGAGGLFTHTPQLLCLL